MYGFVRSVSAFFSLWIAWLTFIFPPAAGFTLKTELRGIFAWVRVCLLLLAFEKATKKIERNWRLWLSFQTVQDCFSTCLCSMLLQESICLMKRAVCGNCEKYLTVRQSRNSRWCIKNRAQSQTNDRHLLRRSSTLRYCANVFMYKREKDHGDTISVGIFNRPLRKWTFSASKKWSRASGVWPVFIRLQMPFVLSSASASCSQQRDDRLVSSRNCLFAGVIKWNLFYCIVRVSVSSSVAGLTTEPNFIGIVRSAKWSIKFYFVRKKYFGFFVFIKFVRKSSR